MRLVTTTVKISETTTKEVVTSTPIQATSSLASTTKAPTVTIETTSTGLLLVQSAVASFSQPFQEHLKCTSLSLSLWTAFLRIHNIVEQCHEATKQIIKQKAKEIKRTKKKEKEF